MLTYIIQKKQAALQICLLYIKTDKGNGQNIYAKNIRCTVQ
jgi:hypothetical protein